MVGSVEMSSVLSSRSVCAACWKTRFGNVSARIAAKK
jgi:hypothetical protein